MHSPSVCPYQERRGRADLSSPPADALDGPFTEAARLPKRRNFIKARRPIRGGDDGPTCVLYKTPKDAGAFDAYYFNTHVPIARSELRAPRRGGHSGAPVFLRANPEPRGATGKAVRIPATPRRFRLRRAERPHPKRRTETAG
jgi:hypothetical protein